MKFGAGPSDPAPSVAYRRTVALIVQTNVDLAPMTTLGVGGPAGEVVVAASRAELAEAVTGHPDAFVLGGGSNVVISDSGVAGRVVCVANKGIAVDSDADSKMAVVTAEAGEDWDELVQLCVSQNLAGLETLSGIPGRTGATPVQNVGAYGQEVARYIETVWVFDRVSESPVAMSAEECGFRYRHSVFKANNRYLITAVSFRLFKNHLSSSVAYPELARRLGIDVGDVAPLQTVRDVVLELRRSKGMVIDPSDADTRSVGSFFTNPILDAESYIQFCHRATDQLGSDADIPAWPQPGGGAKVSAAWLIQHSGVERGTQIGGARISSKHTLAITNAGGATAADVLALSRQIVERVQATFDITLVPEPVMVGY